VFVLLYSEFIELATINRYKTVSIRVSRIEPDPSARGTVWAKKWFHKVWNLSIAFLKSLRPFWIRKQTVSN